MLLGAEGMASAGAVVVTGLGEARLDGGAAVAGEDRALREAAARFTPLAATSEGDWVFPNSLHSEQFLITSETVSLMRLQWYRSAIRAVVLLMPAWAPLCTLRAMSYWRCGSEMTSLSLSINTSPSRSL